MSKDGKLCIPNTFLWLQLIKELHESALTAHAGRDKIIALLEERYFWPQFKKEVVKFIQRCHVCQISKGSINSKLYTPLLVPYIVWQDLSMNFICGLPMIQRRASSILVVVDRFFKMVHLLACKKVNDASRITSLFFKEIIRLMGCHSPLHQIEM